MLTNCSLTMKEKVFVISLLTFITFPSESHKGHKQDTGRQKELIRSVINQATALAPEMLRPSHSLALPYITPGRQRIDWDNAGSVMLKNLARLYRYKLHFRLNGWIPAFAGMTDTEKFKHDRYNLLGSIQQSSVKKQFLTESQMNTLVKVSDSKDKIYQSGLSFEDLARGSLSPSFREACPREACPRVGGEWESPQSHLQVLNRTDISQASVKNFNTDNTVTQDKKVKPSTLSHVTPKTSTEKDTSSVLFKLTNEVRLSQNLVSRNQKKPYPSIPYTALSLDYSQLPVDFFMEWEFFPKSEQIIRVSEINLSYTFKNFPIQLQTGWLPLPLGYWAEHTNLFLRDLSLHQALSENGEDVGVTLRADLWKKHLYLQVSGFGGYVKREEEDFYRAPDFSPLIVSLKAQNSFGEGFVTWFKKDLALFDFLQAIGGGLHLKHSFKNLKASVQGELWLMDEKNQTTFSYYVFPEIKWNKWKAGIVLGDINRFFPHIKKSTARISLYERAFQISWNIHPYITLTAERFLTKQRKGPFLNDLWAVRLQTQFEF